MGGSAGLRRAAEPATVHSLVGAPSGEAPLRCLLDLDPDLADELHPELQRIARGAATVQTFETEPGQLAVPTWLERCRGGPGLLLLGGVLAISVQVGDRVSVELVGAGDLLSPVPREADALLACEVSWRALVSARFAFLDDAFGRRVRFWPQINQALLRRAGRRAINLDVQRAISAQPRLEVRLALLLWHLAGRWGKVEPGGIRLPIPLTHQLLGWLVGAERPSISHALARLAQSGLVTGHGDEWHLHGRIEDQLSALIGTLPSGVEPVVTSMRGR